MIDDLNPTPRPVHFAELDAYYDEQMGIEPEPVAPSDPPQRGALIESYPAPLTVANLWDLAHLLREGYPYALPVLPEEAQLIIDIDNGTVSFYLAAR